MLLDELVPKMIVCLEEDLARPLPVATEKRKRKTKRRPVEGMIILKVFCKEEVKKSSMHLTVRFIPQLN